jgi:hypothetical protein
MKLNKSLSVIFIVFSIFALINIFSGQIPAVANSTQTTAPAKDNAPKPRIVFEKNYLDFGKIGPETKPSGEFKFKNTGNAVLVISQVSQCCGIVTTLEKKQYEPGESGVIKVTYNASSNKGMISRQPIVYSNDPVEPNFVLTVSAEIVNKVTTLPDKLKLFLDENNAKCPKVTIASSDKKPFSIRDIQSTGNCITAQFDPNSKATEFVLDFKVDMAKLQQNMRGNVDIVITHPEMNLVTMPFDVLSKFTVNPPRIIALNTTPGEPVTRKIWVFNNYNQEFEIESITSKNNYISVLSQSKVNDGFQFEIKLTPPPADGKSSYNDELYIKIKNGENLQIDCNGYYSPPAATESTKEKK